MPVIPESQIGFDDFLEQARTCDVVLFTGTSWESEGVEWSTWGKYSHAAMIATGPDGEKYLFQAAGEPLEFDPDKGAKHPGAQLGGLRATMIDVVSYHDDPFYRGLELDRSADFDERVWAAIAAIDGRPFPELWKMVEEYAGGLVHLDMTAGPMFCSELVAYVFQQVGLIDHSWPANAYCPTDFSSDRPNGVALRSGSFSPEQHIVDVPAR